MVSLVTEDFEFVHLERHIIAVEVAPVVNVLRIGVYDRVVAGGVYLAHEHALHVSQCIEHRAQYLRVCSAVSSRVAPCG